MRRRTPEAVKAIDDSIVESARLCGPQLLADLIARHRREPGVFIRNRIWTLRKAGRLQFDRDAGRWMAAP